VYSTCFEDPGVHPQEDLRMQFYGISFMHPYKQFGQWQDVSNTSCHQPNGLYECMKEIPQNCMYILTEDEHLDVRNMSKTL